MLAQETHVTSLQDLRELVYDTLCGYDQLEPGAFPMTERILTKRSRPCGILFCVQGPRRVQYSSVWETETNTLLFYGSSGERFLKIQLVEAPQLAGIGHPGTHNQRSNQQSVTKAQVPKGASLQR